MKGIKYLLSLGLLLCAAVSAQQQFAAGGTTRLDTGRIKSDRAREIKGRTKVEEEPRQTVATEPAGTLTGDRMIRGMSPFVQRKYKTNPYYGFSDTRPWILTNKPRFRLCTTPVISVQALNPMVGIC